MPTNGHPASTLINSTPQRFELSARPDVPPLVVELWPDWRGAPSDTAALFSVMAAMLVQQSHVVQMLANRIAALEIHTAEQSRGAEPQTGDRARDEERASLAITAIRSVADAMQISASAPSSAMDGITLQ